MGQVKDGIVCHTGSIVDHNVSNLELVYTGLSQIRMSYRPATLLFMDIIDGEFKPKVAKYWIFAIIIVASDKTWGKFVEYIESDCEEWAREAAYSKAIAVYCKIMKQHI
jgi:hypothetical protein